jgi:hypothetical protein
VDEDWSLYLWPCVCVILYLISRYMQPKRVMTAAPPKAVAFFIYRFSLAQSQSEDQNTRTGLTGHSGAPTAPTKRKRPHAPKTKPNSRQGMVGP